MAHSPKYITIFNHKGGVGKTTLTINIAAALAKQGKTVLLVDSDPQCNLTSYLLADDVVDDYLENSDSARGKTVWSALRPIYNQTGHIHSIRPVETGLSSRLHVLPGDIRLAQFEEFLQDAWTDCFKRRTGALRSMAALGALAATAARRVNADFVFYDTGPNIGPLNRAILLDTDYFIVPVACDLFSVRALATLGQALKKWITDWMTVEALAPDDEYLLPGMPRFLGFIPQKFRVYGQTMAKTPAQYLRQIERRMYSDVTEVLREVSTDLSSEATLESKLGQVKDFARLVQEAQGEGVALWDVSNGDADQKTDAKIAFREIATNIVKRAVKNADRTELAS